jgi:D-threonate/D-erythronate kinase
MAGPPRVLIIADDLTGAMDSAGPFAAAGAEAWVVADPMKCDWTAFASARVVSVNTDTRHMPATQAADRVRAIAARLAIREYGIVFKKIDSTLRGNVVSETLALMDAAQRKRAIVAPAFPAQGRTVRDGVVYVNGIPLAQTAFAVDKLSPPPRERLHEAFAASGASPAAAGPPTPGFLDDGAAGVRVVDAADEADLAFTITAIRPQLHSLLLAGSAGLTQALARDCFEGKPRVAGQGVRGTIVFAVGSRAARSAEQVDALAEQADTQVLCAPNGQLQNGEFPRARNVVLKATADASERNADATAVAGRMALHAVDLARRTRAEAIVATGGDTAIAILAASGNPALKVLGDLMPGIPYASIRLDGAPLWLVTKAGGFGDRDTFRDVALRLRSGG